MLTLNQAHPCESVNIAWPSALDLAHELEVDVENDLHMSGEEVLDERDRPHLESLGEDRVVGVRESASDDVPGVVKVDVLLVDQDPLELDDGERRVGVVELDGNVVRELGPGHVDLLPSADDVVQRGGRPEVLLLETELLAGPVAVEVHQKTRG